MKYYYISIITKYFSHMIIDYRLWIIGYGLFGYRDMDYGFWIMDYMDYMDFIF